MKHLAFPTHRNRPALHLMAKDNSELVAWVNHIRLAERSFVGISRDPTVLLPLSLPNELGAYLRAKYKGQAVGFSLQWIKKLREDHDLHACPMCGSTNVTSLDHYLPKEIYPELCVFSYNLIPSCVPCNQRRGTKAARTLAGKSFVHPYFDGEILENVEFNISFSAPYSSAKFSLDVSGVTGGDLERIKGHLDASIPKVLFKRSIGSLWSKWRHRIFAKQDLVASRLDLHEDLTAHVRTVSRNSWEAAFLRGLLADTVALNWMLANSPQ